MNMQCHALWHVITVTTLHQPTGTKVTTREVGMKTMKICLMPQITHIVRYLSLHLRTRILAIYCNLCYLIKKKKTILGLETHSKGQRHHLFPGSHPFNFIYPHIEYSTLMYKQDKTVYTKSNLEKIHHIFRNFITYIDFLLNISCNPKLCHPKRLHHIQ